MFPSELLFQNCLLILYLKSLHTFERKASFAKLREAVHLMMASTSGIFYTSTKNFIRYFFNAESCLFIFNFTADSAVVLSESVGILACGLARTLRITMHICLFIQYPSYNIYLEKETFLVVPLNKAQFSAFFVKQKIKNKKTNCVLLRYQQCE